MIVVYVLLALLVLMLLIFIHELGHYLVGKKLGFKIEEFAIGFGKAIWQKQTKSGEKISIRILPLGGFCSFYGEDGQQKDENGNIVEIKDPQAFTSQKPWKRILVFLAGVTFNFLSAIIFAFILLLACGYGNVYNVTHVNPYYLENPQSTNQITEIKENDRIIAINGTKINYVWEKTAPNIVTDKTEGVGYYFTVLKNGTNEEVTYFIQIQNAQQQEYKENTETGEWEWIPQVDEHGNPVIDNALGLELALGSMPLGFWDALVQSFSLTVGFAWMVLKTLWLLITFQLPLSALGGTGTIISTVATNMAIDMKVLLVYLPLISANLAIMNLLPFPALDGSHVVFTTIEAIRRKPINRNVEAIIHFVGLIILFAFVITLDLIHFLG